jgi:hypothetical protein
MTVTLVRPRISGVTENWEQPFMFGSRCDRNGEDLYQACPSAFWLAPEDGTIAPPSFDLRPQPSELASAPESIPVDAVWNGAHGGLVATMLAGPIFVGLFAVALLPSMGIAVVGGAVLIGIVACPFGMMLSCLPVALGSLALGELGRTRPLARLRRVWATTGALMGLAISGLFDAELVTIPLVLTSVACALVAHRGVQWGQRFDDPAPANHLTAPAAIIA